MGRARRGLVAGFMLLAVAAVLTGCYLPDKFRAEIRISRSGAFAVTYEGELVYAPLYADLVQGKLSPQEAPEKIAVAERDLRRDSGFKSVESLGNGRFSVSYEGMGAVGGRGFFTFIRRNADILSIKSRDGAMVIRANALSAVDGQRLMQLGLGMTGEFRVTTDAPVREHNAAAVRSYAGYQIYIWQIENPLSPSPRIVLEGPRVSG